MVILAIDPSITSMGYAVFQDRDIIASGKIKTKSEDKYQDRLKEISQNISYLINKHNPKVMAIETQYLTGIQSNSILMVTEVKGICVGIFYEKTSDGVVKDVKPMEMKAAMGMPKGTRKEYKKWSVEFVKKIYPQCENINNDTADAICIGLTAMSDFAF